jgi:hypothetical protein
MGAYDAHHNIATELIGSDALCSAFDVTNVGESPRRFTVHKAQSFVASILRSRVGRRLR